MSLAIGRLIIGLMGTERGLRVQVLGAWIVGGRFFIQICPTWERKQCWLGGGSSEQVVPFRSDLRSKYNISTTLEASEAAETH